MKAGLEVIIAKYAGGVGIDIGSSKEEKAAAKAWAQRLDVRVIVGFSFISSAMHERTSPTGWDLFVGKQYQGSPRVAKDSRRSRIMVDPFHLVPLAIILRHWP